MSTALLHGYAEKIAIVVWITDIDEDDNVWLRVYATDNLGVSSSDDTDGSFIVDNVAPHHWRDFAPADWVADQTPGCTIEAKDITAGLDISTACYNSSSEYPYFRIHLYSIKHSRITQQMR